MEEKIESTEQKQPPKGLTVGEFFERCGRLPDCSLTSAHRVTGISYSTIHDLAHGRVESPRKDTLLRLEEWSRKAGAAHGFYISAQLTMGFVDAPVSP